MVTQYFEEIAVGETRSFGERTITREEIVEFAEQYDPQPFHVDEEAARESVMGGLVASGWHTAAICMRLLVENADDRALAGSRNCAGSNRSGRATPSRSNSRSSTRTTPIGRGSTTWTSG